jgi:protein SCO1/2
VLCGFARAKKALLLLGLVLVALALGAGAAHADEGDDRPLPGYGPSDERPIFPGTVPDGVAFEQKLNAQVPLNLRFRDENDHAVELKQLFNGKPVVLSLGYYTCPMLCPLSREELALSLKRIQFSVGQEFNVVNVSIDPKEVPATAAATKVHLMQQYGRAGAENGWHLLTGAEAEIKQLADAVGFGYSYDNEHQQYIHGAGIIMLTPQGKVSRYLYGTSYAANDLRLGLTEASNNTIGSPVEQLLLLCFHYDPTTGKYTPLIENILRGFTLSAATVLIGFVAFNLQREKKRKFTAENAE